MTEPTTLWEGLEHYIQQLKFGKLRIEVTVELDIHRSRVTGWTIVEHRPKMTLADVRPPARHVLE